MTAAIFHLLACKTKHDKDGGKDKKEAAISDSCVSLFATSSGVKHS